MKILANENFPRPAVEALRDRGHDILWARTEMPGIDDDAVLDRAQRENRLVLTMDKDFGELAFRWGLPSSCGVVLFGVAAHSPQWITSRIVNVMGSRSEWAESFAVVEEHRTRVRPLPAREQTDRT
jgi:predicted nuclease of predicted toxin-antitoxin system